MGTSLNGLTPAGTYPGLIKTGDNAPIDGTLKTLSDGNGNNLPMSVSTSTINLTGTAQVGGVAIANTTQVAAKQDTLVSGTNIKTINSTSILGAGNISVAPASGIDATAIADGSVTNAEFQFINTLTSNAQTQIDGKQATLVSGTNIKTINSTSLLGSGNVAVQETLVSGTNIKTINGTSVLGSGNIVTPSTSPSGSAGYIQFSNGSAFASDANLFWDNTNKRLGIGTNAPSGTAHFKGSGSTSATTSLLVQNSSGTNLLQVTDDGQLRIPVQAGQNINNIFIDATSNNTSVAKMGIINGGYVGQFYLMSVGTTAPSFPSAVLGKALIQVPSGLAITSNNAGAISNTDIAMYIYQSKGVHINGFTEVLSAQLNVESTTKGFLPPRMTTAQKNAIATPASGLVVYDTTTNKLCCYNGTSWNDLF